MKFLSVLAGLTATATTMSLFFSAVAMGVLAWDDLDFSSCPGAQQCDDAQVTIYLSVLIALFSGILTVAFGRVTIRMARSFLGRISHWA